MCVNVSSIYVCVT